MKKIILILSVLLLSGCTLSEIKENKKPRVGLANPASVHCEEKGGKLEMRENSAGTYGVCLFTDGSECDEWAYFRGECLPKSDEVYCAEGNQPVCAKVQVQCVRAPCPPVLETIVTSCEAKKRGAMILGMVNGKCEKELEDACKTDADCSLPMDYAVRSSCPFAVKCLTEKCVVVCPAF